MKSVIVGTAGHIDHGKSALVRALTGTDPDRLDEEKRRGITIDLGFAHLDLPGAGGEKLRLGFVDVPGHERFVRNMLAGVGGIDFVLLVIAADESIKPQTREHFDICRLLSVKRGITVLTKSDLVDTDTLEVVRLEVEDFLRGSFLDPCHAPIVAVSAKTGAGLDELKQALTAVALEVPGRDADAISRLPIDRVFTMKGFGTVVTGTLVSGRVRKDDELEVFPTGQSIRVRSVQVHGENVDYAIAGQRVALNLAGTPREDLRRGMTLAPLNTFQSTRRADVFLNLLPSARPLKNRSRVHLHAHTTECIAEVVFYSGNPLPPGQTAFAQLRLAEPLLLLPGDRFIVRQFSPVITIGGGVVLDATPLPKAKNATALSQLAVLADGDEAASMTLRISRRAAQGLTMRQAVAETGWRQERVAKAAAPSLKSGDILQIGHVFLARSALEAMKQDALALLDKFHQHNPLVRGMSKEELREQLQVSVELFPTLLDSLLRDKKIEAEGEQVRLAGRGVVLKDEEAESQRTIEQAFATAGLKVPALKDVLAGLKVDRTRAQKIVTLLLRDRVLVKISDDLVFHRAALEALRRQVSEYKKTSPKIDVGRFKELTGITRKYAIPLLEYLDRERVTRRAGNERVIL
jgi:selenocysteine-specific elongation factor